MNYLDSINRALAAVTYPSEPKGLYEPIAYALSMGGKRLRPTLVLLACAIYRDDTEVAMPAALAIETYHNHTLLHDDLMDHADMRRGKPTVHVKWDENTAVLSGDAMLIAAFRHLINADCPNKDRMLSLFVRTTNEICEGQQHDVNFEKRTDVTEEEYIEMIRLKTSVLLGCAAKLGALAGNAPDTDADALYRFAEKIGLAFQLQDDYLDVYGDPAVFGKQIGGDILCGKKTFLLIHALQKADAETKKKLLQILEDKDMEPALKIRTVTDIYDQLSIPALTLAAIDRFYDAARRELAAVTAGKEKTAPIWEYACSLLKRQV
ncbi:MAG: polyprenyl synthetase family protein [Alloprevotella sp.]